jgi:site-specific DNA-methyltransferase (adenine-specific)
MESIVHHADCMEIMAQYPDKHFDLAVVDPPYGIGAENHAGKKENGWKQWTVKSWDNSIPNKEYFEELKRVSKNQIIWGGNYMTEFLQPSMGWIIWDKGQRDFSLADGEMAWTSFNKAMRIWEYSRSKTITDNKIHPTQKPIKLYDWIYKNYLPEGGKVIDTHLGSGSNRIAADKAGNINFVGCELDKDYFDAQEKRWSNYKAQLTIQF